MNTLVTITIGSRYEEIAKLTHPTLWNYAKKIGADFINWKETGNHIHPSFKKLEIEKLLHYYDRVFYVDADVIIRSDTPNIFDIVSESMFGAFNEFPFTNRVPAMSSFKEDREWIKNEIYFNAGVFVASQGHREMFQPQVPEIDNFYEQTYLNYNLYKLQIPFQDLTFQFNRMSCMDFVKGAEKENAYIIHYAGTGNEDLSYLKSKIQTDLDLWRR